MKWSKAGAGLLLLMTALCGCNTEQPLRIGAQTVEVDLRYPGTSACEYDIWDIWADVNQNGLLDSGDEPAVSNSISGGAILCGSCFPYASGARSVALPLPFSVEISVIRAGTAQREVITNPAAARATTSRTQEPPVFDLTPPIDPMPASCVTSTSHTVACLFDNPRRVPDTNAEVMVCGGNGEFPVPQTNIGGLPRPVRIEMGGGDTLIVTAGKGADARFEGTMTLNGAPITPDTCTGGPPCFPVTFSEESRGVISFSFRLR